MTTARYTCNEALARALAEHKQPTQNWHGMCLRFVRTMVGIAAKYDEAEDAWTGARKRHTNATPPAGSAVFWAGGEHGHVALSAGSGYVWSTDILRRGGVDKVSIGTVASKWGYRLLGWTEDLNGVSLQLVQPPPRLSLSEVQWAATHSNLIPGSESRIALIRTSLRQLGCGSDSFRNVWQRWQWKLGYKGADADGIPGPASCAALATRCGYVVTP